ncbi:MAG: RidA family protein [Pseudomonadota bacterium]
MRFLAIALSLLVFSAWAQAHEPIVFHSEEAYRDAGYPFSAAVEADGLIFLSGTLGTLPGTTKLIEGGIKAETRQTMDNIKATLATIGAEMDDIVKCTAMLADMAEWPAFNSVYKTYFQDNYPARSAFGASGLALGARIEIECIAQR